MPAEAQEVRQLFDAVAPHYDRLNDLLSLGLHRLWKREMVQRLAPAAGEQWLDLCCGTGDLALVLAERLRTGGGVLAVDAAAAPLQQARRRHQRCPWLPVEWLQADALAVPRAVESFDGAVMAYGLRNLPDPAAGLRELRRLLHRDGRAAVLDFNRSTGTTAVLQTLALRRVVVPVASQLGLKEQYAYLETSIAEFPTGLEQEQLAMAAGFSWAQHRPMAGGLMGLLELRC